jgi:hypothetical protein
MPKSGFVKGLREAGKLLAACPPKYGTDANNFHGIS